MPKAIRAYQENGSGEDLGCAVEPQFRELFAVLGDKVAQDKIREGATQPGCPLLRHRPSACRGCDNNPYENPKLVERHKLISENRRLLTDAFRVWEMSELGFLGGLDDLSPQAFTALRIVRSEMEVQRAKQQAYLIGDRIAERLGGKKSGG